MVNNLQKLNNVKVFIVVNVQIHASSNRQLTFRQIHDGSIKLASAFTKFGLKKQEVVAICAANCVEYSLIVLGASACNAISTTCNPRHTKSKISISQSKIFVGAKIFRLLDFLKTF